MIDTFLNTAATACELAFAGLLSYHLIRWAIAPYLPTASVATEPATDSEPTTTPVDYGIDQYDISADRVGIYCELPEVEVAPAEEVPAIAPVAPEVESEVAADQPAENPVVAEVPAKGKARRRRTKERQEIAPQMA